MSPEASARWRLACGTLTMFTSSPFFLKMPASLASVSGAKPVQPDMPIETAVSAAAEPAARPSEAATEAAKSHDFFI